MAKRCPKRFVLGFTESGKFYFYSKTLQQLMSSGYVYLVPRVFIRYTRVRTYSAWTSVLLVRNKRAIPEPRKAEQQHAVPLFLFAQMFGICF